MTSPPRKAADDRGVGSVPAMGNSTARASSPPKAHADSPEVLALVRSELPRVDVVATILNRQLGGRVQRDDLVSFGREGLLQAARSFDLTRGVPFTRWASFRIHGSMIDGVRSQSLLPASVYRKLRAIESAHHASEAAAEDGSARHSASADEADARLTTYLAGIATAVTLGLLATPTPGATFDEPDGFDPTPTAEDVLGGAETLAAVREAMVALPEHERHLVQRHYFDDVRLDEAAAEIGLSKSWGSRLHGRAIESLTRHMARTKTTL